MDCQTVQLGISAYLDSAISSEEQREMVQHLGACPKCSGESERYRELRAALRSVPKRTPPPDLIVRLRVAASKARVSRFHGWRERFQLSLRNLMRPLALPAAGGLCSAVFLFSTLVPTFRAAFAMDNSPGDVPTMLTTEPTLKFMAPVAFFNGDAVVDLKIDDRGRIINYSILGAPGPASDQLRHSIENSLLFTEFWPATNFGRPIAGTIRISFRSSHIDVRG
jgi:hypothetical protein